MTEYYGLDSKVLLALIQDKAMPVTRTLELIPYLHSGYVDTILPRSSENGNRKNT